MSTSPAVPARYAVRADETHAVALFLETVKALRASAFARTAVAGILGGDKRFGMSLRIDHGQPSAEVRMGDPEHLRSLLIDLRKLVLQEQPQNLNRVFNIVKRAEHEAGDTARLEIATRLHEHYKTRMRGPTGMIDPTRATKPASTSPEDMLAWMQSAPTNLTREEFLIARLHGDLFHDDADQRARLPEGNPWADGARHGFLAMVVLDVYLAADDLARFIVISSPEDTPRNGGPRPDSPGPT